LVPNPSFEIYSSLPTGPTECSLSVGWGNVNGGTGWPYASPDYFHNNGTGYASLPASGPATVNAYDGDAIMGMLLYATVQNTDFREYITIQLNTPMVVGTTYTISFSLTNGASNISCGTSCDHVAIQFSNGPLSQTDHEPIGGVPQIEIAGEVWTNLWQDYTFNYVATAPYDYLTFGNFSNNASTSFTTQLPGAQFSDWAYYYVDKFEILTSAPILQVQGDTLICIGSTATLNGWNDPNSSYAWANQLTPSTIISTDSSIIVSPLTNTTYLLYGSDDTLSVTVNVESPPVVDLGNDTTLCMGEVLNLDATNPFSTYQWQDGSVNSTFLVSTSGLYSVDVANNCGMTTDSINVIFESMPILDLGADTTFCESVNLILDASTPNCSYLWQDLSTASTITVNQPGTYSVELTHSCGTVTDAINVLLDFPPVVDLGNDTALCIGEVLMLDVTNPLSTYLWNDNSTTPTFLVSVPGVYSVDVTNYCGITSDNIEVIYASIPTIFIGEDTTFCDSSNFVLDATSVGCSYLWQDFSTSPVYEVNESGTYSIELTNNCGSASDTIEIVAEMCGIELQMPNIFTPNNDGANDQFIPVKMEGIMNAHIVILNRWGEVVFESDDLSLGWNGKISGENCSDGVYYYLVNYWGINDAGGTKHGFVTVVR
jgi:gliding motility-associated-like protein